MKVNKKAASFNAHGFSLRLVSTGDQPQYLVPIHLLKLIIPQDTFGEYVENYHNQEVY